MNERQRRLAMELKQWEDRIAVLDALDMRPEQRTPLVQLIQQKIESLQKTQEESVEASEQEMIQEDQPEPAEAVATPEVAPEAPKEPPAPVELPPQDIFSSTMDIISGRTLLSGSNNFADKTPVSKPAEVPADTSATPKVQKMAVEKPKAQVAPEAPKLSESTRKETPETIKTEAAVAQPAAPQAPAMAVEKPKAQDAPEAKLEIPTLSNEPTKEEMANLFLAGFKAKNKDEDQDDGMMVKPIARPGDVPDDGMMIEPIARPGDFDPSKPVLELQAKESPIAPVSLKADDSSKKDSQAPQEIEAPPLKLSDLAGSLSDIQANVKLPGRASSPKPIDLGPSPSGKSDVKYSTKQPGVLDKQPQRADLGDKIAPAAASSMSDRRVQALKSVGIEVPDGASIKDVLRDMKAQSVAVKSMDDTRSQMGSPGTSFPGGQQEDVGRMGQNFASTADAVLNDTGSLLEALATAFVALHVRVKNAERILSEASF